MAFELNQPVSADVSVGRLAFIPPPAARLDPTAGLRKGGCLVGEKASVGDFWAWAFSDLRQNNVRGHLAEYIVGLALSAPLAVRSS